MEIRLALWEHDKEEEGQAKEQDCAIAEPVTFTSHNIVLQGHNDRMVKDGLKKGACSRGFVVVEVAEVTVVAKVVRSSRGGATGSSCGRTGRICWWS